MQNVLLRLREVQPSLSSTERQIAQFILDNPNETTTLTIRELARRSFSSPSSVVRICRVIGFQGYKELRHALTLELATLGENGSHREKDITPQDSLQEIVDKVTHKNIQSLLDTQRLLLLDELEECVELIANARTVLLFGIGSSLCVAKDTYLKFLRLDKPCVVNEDSHSQILQARNAKWCNKDMQTMHMGHQPMIWLIDENHARGVFQYEDHMCYYDDCEVLQSWMVYCDDFVKGEDGAWRIQKLRMAYREMDGNFRTTMVPKDWVPDAWDTPDY